MATMPLCVARLSSSIVTSHSVESRLLRIITSLWELNLRHPLSSGYSDMPIKTALFLEIKGNAIKQKNSMMVSLRIILQRVFAKSVGSSRPAHHIRLDPYQLQR